jgi:hypothetical protein
MTVHQSESRKLSLEFEQPGQFFFSAKGTRMVKIRDLRQLGAALLERFEMGGWDRHQVVVIEVITSSSLVVFISNVSNAKAELIIRPAGPDGKVEMQMLREDGLGFQLIQPTFSTPLYRVAILRNRLFGIPMPIASPMGETYLAPR